MNEKPAAAESADASPLSVRPGFAIPPAVLDFVALSSVKALVGRDRKQREARRSLAELTRIVGEVLHRVRSSRRKAAGTAREGPAAP